MATLPNPITVRCDDLTEYTNLLNNLAQGIPNVVSYIENAESLEVNLIYDIYINVNPSS